MRARPALFVWQEHVCAIASRYPAVDPFDGPHATRLLAFAIDFSATCNGLTGRDCWLTPSLLRRIPRRTAGRYLSVLVGAGLVERTAAPTRGSAGQPGRAAKYGLVVPPIVGHGYEDSWPTKAMHVVAHDRAQPPSLVAVSASTIVGHARAQTWPGTSRHPRWLAVVAA